MPVADHQLATAAVVGQKENQRVFELTHVPQLLEDAAQLLVDSVDHRCMNGHLGSLEFFLLFG